jgi:hypothetical protein
MSLNDTSNKAGEANTSDPLHAENNLKQVGPDVLCLLRMFRPFLECDMKNVQGS